MRIALVCDELPPRRHGGIGTFVATYARGLADAGHDVTVVEPDAAGGERDEDGVRVVGVRTTTVRGIAWWRDRTRLRRALAAEQSDVIEVPDYRGWLPWGAGGTPLVVRLHGSQTVCAAIGGPPAGRRARWCERETLRRAAACIHPSRHALAAAVAVAAVGTRGNAPATLVPHPAPALPPVDGQPAGRPQARVVLFVGSLWGFRGVRAAAGTVQRVLSARDDVHAVFVGAAERVDGTPSYDVIRAQTGADLAGRVHLTGHLPRTEVARWMRTAEVLLHPGEHEAFGLVLLEAMSAGLPVVGSARGACGEIVADGSNGLTAAPDDPDALAAAVLRVLDDTDLARRLTDAARDDVGTRFSVERCVAASVRVYEQALIRRR